MLGTTTAEADLEGPTPTDEVTARAVFALFEREHLLKPKINDEIAGGTLDELIRGLDPSKLYFRKMDVDEFRREREGLAPKLKQGNVAVAFQIYRRFQQRVAQASLLWKEFLGPEARYDFTVDEFTILNPDALEHPTDESEARERWRLQFKYEMLRLKSAPGGAELKMSAERAKLWRRYEKFARRTNRTKNDWLAGYFLTCATNRFDHLSIYMSPSTWKDIESGLAARVEGIGASLKDDDGMIVTNIVPGGPAEKDGRLKPGDRIVGIEKSALEMIDFADMTLNEAVAAIRGPAGTKVSLIVVPRGESQQKVYEVARGTVLRSESMMTSRRFEQGTKPDGIPCKIGYIELPSLYKDKATGGRSASLDVRRELQELARRGVEVVVLDLRRNGGGMFDESIALADLFINRGPVCQEKDNRGTVKRYDGTEEGAIWDKALVVLTSRQTGSGCEIFCGAIQDYNRGLIVGDESTFGLGTVQRLYNVADGQPKSANPPDLGRLRLTWAQFYRPNGDSTQKRGVYADLVLPSIKVITVEDFTQNRTAIGFDRVSPIAHDVYGMLDRAVWQTLQDRSRARRHSSPEFQKQMKGIDQERHRRRQLLISLNEQKFLEQRMPLDSPANVSDHPGERDYYLNEVLAVAADYVNLLGGRRALPDARLSAPEQKAELEILELERAIDRDRALVAKYEQDIQGWADVIVTCDQAMKQAGTAGQGSLVALGRRYADGEKAKAERRNTAAESTLDADRDRLVRLREESSRLRH